MWIAQNSLNILQKQDHDKTTSQRNKTLYNGRPEKF